MVRADDYPRLAEKLTEIVRNAGGVLWADRARLLLARAENIRYTEVIPVVTYAVLDAQTLEFVNLDAVWYPSTLRIVGETALIPLAEWTTPTESMS